MRRGGNGKLERRENTVRENTTMKKGSKEENNRDATEGKLDHINEKRRWNNMQRKK